MRGYVSYNGVDISTETPLGVELLKWERKPDYRPENHPYPKMLYKAYKGGDGIVRCMDSDPSPYLFADMGLHQRAIDRVRAFNESCTKIVQTEEEHKRAHGDGWRTSAKEAEDAQHGWEHDMQQAAAERAFADRNMSEKAKAEIAQAESATTEQLAMVPEGRGVKKVHWKTAQKLAKEAVGASV